MGIYIFCYSATFYIKKGYGANVYYQYNRIKLWLSQKNIERFNINNCTIQIRKAKGFIKKKRNQ